MWSVRRKLHGTMLGRVIRKFFRKKEKDPSAMGRAALKAAADFDAPVVIISYPKSGRTWHRVMLGGYLAQLCKRPLKSALDLEVLCKKNKIPETIYTHNGAVDGVHYSDPSVARTDLWIGRDIFLIVRILLTSWYRRFITPNTAPAHFTKISAPT